MEIPQSAPFDDSQMAKEPKQFRKGTKSCIECRQRKLRCIPPSDGSQSCQNCAAKGRECVLQVHAGRSSEKPNATSRDRIRHLENSVGRLWTVVKDLRSELGHTQNDSKQAYDQQSEDQDQEESDSDTSETSPINPPNHLQQLFDNDVLDIQSSGFTPESSSTNSSTVQRARSKLQVLIPSREDVQAIGPVTETWLSVYNILFPPLTTFKTLNEILLQYDRLLDADASPTSVAALLLWMAIGVQNAPPNLLQGRAGLVQDVVRFTRRVSETVEEVIVNSDTLAASIEGIEISLFWTRLQLVRTQSRKPWIALRRCIALAELIGLPRAARVVNSATANNFTVYDTRQQAAATVWESLCVVDRLAGLIFALPLGTARHGLPRPQEVIDAKGKLIVKAYMTHVGRIAGDIQDLDDISFSQRPDVELFEKVFKVDQDLRSLRAMTPDIWWALGPESGVADHLMQYWHTYITIRAHLQLALRNSKAYQYAYSYLTCTQASRELAARYVKLRSLVPLTFFAGRLIDLEAMTAAVFLIYISYTSAAQPVVNLPEDGGQSSRELAFDCVRMMESVFNQAPRNVNTDAVRNGSKAIRALDELLSQPAPAHSQTLSLKIPMLGRINVCRRSSNLSSQSSQANASQFPSTENFDVSGIVATDPSLWSMDLLMEEDFQLPADSYPEMDQWFSFTNG